MSRRTNARNELPGMRSSLQMPQGFYGGDVANPDLAKLVKTHGTQFDPETDSYSIASYDQPIKTTKATAIYNMHTYSSKKPHNAIRKYIQHYTSPGDIVLDPFSGSGGTAIASLLDGRVPIALDLSPAAGFISANSLRVFDCNDFQEAFTQLRKVIEDKVRQRFSWSQPAGLVKAVVYSETLRCVRCLKPVPVIAATAGDIRNFRGRTKAEECCPFCGEALKTAGERLGFVPAEVHVKEPGKSAFTPVNVLGNQDVAERFPVIPTDPPEHLRVTFEGNIQPRLWKNLARAGAIRVADLFSDANLSCLLEITTGIDALPGVSNASRSLLHLAVHAILYNCTRMYRNRAKGGFVSGTYYIPHQSKCINPWESFVSKCKEIERAIDEASCNDLDELSAIVSVESATSFCSSGHIPANSIDYIFTDPPYGGTYHYGALNFLWEAWRGCDLSWRSNEITISEDGSLTAADWRDRMHQSMSECFDALKPGRWISLCFHGEVDLWEAINDIMAEVGFVTSHAEEALFIDTDQKSYNQITGETSKKRDLVISFRKPKPGDWVVTHLYIPADADPATFQDMGRQVIRDFLTSHPGALKDRIYDELISRMVRRGEMESHDFDSLLRSVAEEVTEPVRKNLFENADADRLGSHVVSRWYLKETADQIDSAEQDRENAAADRLGSFMVKYFEQNPESQGVHYSDLFEQIIVIPVEQRPRRLFENWLPEYFFKTTDGTWRPPADEIERQQKEAMREAGTLRRMKRFANALIEGVPVREQDRPDGVLTLVEWIRQCRRAGLYEQGRTMYEKGGLDLSKLDDEEQLEVEDDYRICVKRGSEDAPNKKSKARKKKS